jgi:hypothetical protein
MRKVVAQLLRCRAWQDMRRFVSDEFFSLPFIFLSWAYSCQAFKILVVPSILYLFWV